MTTKIANIPNTARTMAALKNGGMTWYPLVFLWLDSEEECDNPQCAKDVEVKQVHLLNGEICTVQVCFTCAQQLAIDTGMVTRLEDFAVPDRAVSS
jgi:hypothetical protein